MLTRRFLLAAAAASMIAPAATAQDMPFFFVAEDAAMAGYDVVSYFDANAPIQGKSEHAVVWRGAKWQFSTAENREAFERDPRAFAPQFGGYCAYAMAHGSLTGSDPMAWQVVGGRLYMTHSLEVERMWRTDSAEYIRKAEAHWPGILHNK
ncbi:YHS domain-containing (seleno)protein [Ruegeria profundi]|uniref:YHS domain-containing (seleno)protein n=1 Tax=Ruegeria profundi TaxID=1685378 RepID=UPI001CD508CA|nr:YHS domain-containing (seleno)protein [Ruegeria profundi]MCA0928981.1 YHS domain protein [Ruegeria profundi]